MIDALLWYLLITLAGFLAFPLTFRFLGGLSDRGYALARSLGLLIWGYFFWFLASLGWLHNNTGGILVGLSILILLSLMTLRNDGWKSLLAWVREHFGLLFGIEILFLIAFVFIAVVRAANPEILGTEKPMELAFINAILNSETFPPHDPWLSGFAISYYYFGYVLVAMFAKITGTAGSVAFNLGVTLIFALSALGAFSVVYNLLEKFFTSRRVGLGFLQGLLGPFYVLLVSNLGGLLELIHARGWFWLRDDSGNLASTFWTWLDLRDLNLPPTEPFAGVPTRYYWWWRASRVVQDTNLNGDKLEIIDEFPFFSYLLGDLHPHVLAMPFAFLAISLAMNVFFSRSQARIALGSFRLNLDLADLGLATIVLGGLAFLNTWDFPIYVGLFTAAYTLREAQNHGWEWRRFGEFLLLGFLLGIIGVILYLPFYAGFSSQAGGFIPNLIYVTRGAHFWIMFFTLLTPIISLSIYLWRIWPHKPDLKFGLTGAIVLYFVLFGLVLLASFGISLLGGVGNAIITSLGASSQSDLWVAVFQRRITQPGAWITMLFLLAAAIAYLKSTAGQKFERIKDSDPESIRPGSDWSAHAFWWLLVFFGAILVFAPEFFYLRDQFGYRINTIFKFYYQAWILWGLAAAIATAFLFDRVAGAVGWIVKTGMTLVILAGLVYPYFGLLTKTNHFRPVDGWTLDGVAFYARQSPEEMEAIWWLATAPHGIVAEAVGGQYSNYARVATMSGKPNVLGWPGHEAQWRGGYDEMGTRENDIQQLYCTREWTQAEEVLKKYHIRYVFVGQMEYARYQPPENPPPDHVCLRGLQEAKFASFLKVGFENNLVRVYIVSAP